MARIGAHNWKHPDAGERLLMDRRQRTGRVPVSKETREAALTAVVMTIDRWVTRRLVATESVRDTEHDVVG
jgi:hypothetical protein